MDLALIGDEDTIIGFKLAGIKDAAIYEESKIEETIEKYKDAKLLMMTEDVAKTVREKKLDKELQATIIEIPDKQGSKGYAMNEISKLFESAIGVKLNKEGE